MCFLSKKGTLNKPYEAFFLEKGNSYEANCNICRAVCPLGIAGTGPVMPKKRTVLLLAVYGTCIDFLVWNCSSEKSKRNFKKPLDKKVYI